MSAEKNEYLDAVLKTHSIELDEAKIGAYRIARDRIKVALEQKYAAEMYSPLNSGSYAKKTAINTNFDLDLAAPFKKGNFKTLREMYDEVEAYMLELKRSSGYAITSVSRQRRSINLLLNVNGQTLDMDIVPARELNDGSYLDDYKLNLYDSKDKSYIQTNIRAHNELMIGREKERQVIKLLKSWKSAHKADMKSFLVELMVLSAFDRDSTMADKKLYERLHGSLAFMADNITTIKLVDPANSGNLVSGTLTASEKELFKGKFGRMLDDIESSQDKLVEYFPINESHKDVVDPEVLQKFKNKPRQGGYNSFA